MNNQTQAVRPFMALAIGGAVMWLAGCAPAYHCFSGCHIDCKYCPPAPLAHTFYNSHVCHSWQAAPYLAGKHLADKPTAAPQEASQMPTSATSESESESGE